jgi:HSP20 family protein
MFGELLPRSFFREVPELHRVVDALFSPPRDQQSAWWPAVEGRVKDNTLHVRLDLPGVDPKDVQVALEGDVLKVSGERKAETRTDDGGYHYSERRYGSFERTVTVPEGVDPAKITARFNHGVLEVTVPLPTAQGARRVPIQVEGAPVPATPKAA